MRVCFRDSEISKINVEGLMTWLEGAWWWSNKVAIPCINFVCKLSIEASHALVKSLGLIPSIRSKGSKLMQPLLYICKYILGPFLQVYSMIGRSLYVAIKDVRCKEQQTRASSLLIARGCMQVQLNCDILIAAGLGEKCGSEISDLIVQHTLLLHSTF